MTHRQNDHAGLLYLLDSAGRTIEQLEHRVEDLTAQVAQLTTEREQFRAALEQVRADSADVPPADPQAPENGAHDHVPPPA